MPTSRIKLCGIKLCEVRMLGGWGGGGGGGGGGGACSPRDFRPSIVY